MTSDRSQGREDHGVEAVTTSNNLHSAYMVPRW
jgi:hypothetical protein